MSQLQTQSAGSPLERNVVKWQGFCGSCWAFSATAAVEPSHAVARGRLFSLYAQQITDCVRSSIDGGWVSEAWNYLIKHGLIVGGFYLYTSGTVKISGTCKYSYTYKPQF